MNELWRMDSIRPGRRRGCFIICSPSARLSCRRSSRLRRTQSNPQHLLDFLSGDGLTKFGVCHDPVDVPAVEGVFEGLTHFLCHSHRIRWQGSENKKVLLESVGLIGDADALARFNAFVATR